MRGKLFISIIAFALVFQFQTVISAQDKPKEITDAKKLINEGVAYYKKVTLIRQ